MVHSFTPDDMISKPKDVILQIKVMRSCAKNLLEVIDLVEDRTLIAPEYLLGVTNLEMANFAQKYGFEIAEDFQRAKINQRIFRSRNIVTKIFYKESLRIHDSTLNSVVYLKFEDLLATEFRSKLLTHLSQPKTINFNLLSSSKAVFSALT